MGQNQVSLSIGRVALILSVVGTLTLGWGWISTSAEEETPLSELPDLSPSVESKSEPVEVAEWRERLGLSGELIHPKVSVDELRKRYPMRSLRERLAYEDRSQQSGQPNLSPQAEQWLKKDEQMRSSAIFDTRSRSLAMLHSSKAEQFSRQPGRGFSRMLVPTASPEYLPAPDGPPVRLVTTPPLVPSAATGQRVLLAVKSSENYLDPQGMPSQAGLLNFHRRGLENFLMPSRFGYVQDIDHVAGFASHKFISRPKLDPQSLSPQQDQAAKQEPWLLRRLELVSLLKHEEPVAYLSDHLPDLEKLDQYKTRPLRADERRGLKTLCDGEDLSIQAQANQIFMIGALRASTQCLDCHEVERGTLLGAFTYELQRDPPIKAPQDLKVTVW